METRLVNPHDCQFIQSRVLLHPATVVEYADMYRAEISFDPCKGIITPAGAIIIYDGNHRGEAAKQTGSMLEVALMTGTPDDAAWLAAGANTRHGLKRSIDDIENAVKSALRHPNGLGKSDREIARHCSCDHKTVGKYRKQLEASGERPQIDTRTVTRNGTEYQMSIPMPEPESPEVDEPQAVEREPMVFDQHMDPPQKPLPRYETIKITTPDAVINITAPMLDEAEEAARKQEQAQLQEVHARLGLLDVDAIDADLDDESLSMERCDFCGKLYGDDKLYIESEPQFAAGGIVAICKTCISEAIKTVFPNDEHAVLQLYMRDREKIVRSGLRMFSVSGRLGTHELQELLPMKSGGQGYTWQIVEKFDSKAALKRRMHELEHDERIIFERHDL